MITTLVDVESIAGDHTGPSRAVLEYTLVMKRIIDSAKEPGFDESSWGPLAGLVDRDAFIRVGPFKAEMTWPEYVALLTGWAPRRPWECSFRRLPEQGNLVLPQPPWRAPPGDPSVPPTPLST